MSAVSRRVFLAHTAAFLATSFAAEAQQADKVYRGGFLGTTSESAIRPFLGTLMQRMRELGWTERNFTLEARYIEDRIGLPSAAAELVGLNVDVIIAGINAAVAAAKHATTTIPIVMMANDPVGSGFVETLARPGGNVTGLSYDIIPDTFVKHIDFLKEVVPTISRVAVLWDPTFPGGKAYWKATEDAGQRLGVSLHSAEVQYPDEFGAAFAGAVRARAGAVVVFPSDVNFLARTQIVMLAARYRLPTTSPAGEHAAAGSLMSYGANVIHIVRRAAGYVDRILRGAKPADLPVEQPTKYDLVINLKTAKDLRLTIPPALLLRADQLIKS